MRTFQIIRRDGEATLVELRVHNGIYKRFAGANCVSDALRHMRRICSTERTFSIVCEKDHAKL